MSLSSPLSVLLSVGTFPPDHGGGGLRLKRFYERLNEIHPVRVTVLTLANRGEDPGVRDHPPFTVHRMPYNRGSLLFRLIKFFGRTGFTSCDYVHVAGRTRIDVATLAFSELAGSPVIHELTVNDFRELHSGFWNLRSMLVKEIVGRVDWAIALNREIESYYRTLGLNSADIWRRPTPVNTDRFHPPDDDPGSKLRSQGDFPPTQYVHLCVGRFQDRKNQKFALRVLRHLRADHGLVMVGPVLEDDRSYYQSLRDFVMEENLGDRVRFIPEFRDDIETFYRACDSVWIPSRQEGTPNTMLEGLCTGLPVFVSEALNLEEVLAPDDFGRSLPTEPGSFAEAVEKWFVDPEDRTTRHRRARRAQERYAAEKIDRQFLEKLEDVLAD